MGQGVQPKTESTSRGMLRGPRRVSGRACSSSPLIPCPHEVTGQDLPFREDKGDRTTPQISSPPPTSLSPAWPRWNRRGARGVPPHWGVPEVSPGTSRAKGVWTDRGGPPWSLAVTLWGGGGEMTFKGPGRRPHVQEPGPGSRRRQSHSGSAPRGWLVAGDLPSTGDTISLVPSATGCCHHLQGDSSTPATCVPLARTQTSQPSPTTGRGTEGGFPQCQLCRLECPIQDPGDTEQSS